MMCVMKRHSNFALAFIAGLVVAFAPRGASASPCDGVDRSMSPMEKASIVRAVSRDRNSNEVTIDPPLHWKSWWVVLGDGGTFDADYFFYHGDPSTTKLLGAIDTFYRPDEESWLLNWTRSHIPGIPPNLARCFAWHATKDPDG